MASLNTETVKEVKHWSDKLFSFTTTRSESFRFKNGHFTMIGLEVEGKPLMRAYSMASANYEEELEFLSIKVPDGALTSRLKDIQPGDEVLVSSKPTGTLVQEQLLPGKHLYLLSTGTGLAPFMSIIKDPEVYESFEKVILVHGVRFKKELAYADYISSELPQNEYFGEMVQDKLLYYPTVTREPFIHEGRITKHLEEGSLYRDLGLPPFSIEDDRFMICGSMAMLDDTTAWLDNNGYTETRKDVIGQYVIERAFVEK